MSDSIKAQETFDILYENSSIKKNSIQPIISDQLQEKKAGIFAGKTNDDYIRELEKSGKSFREYKPEKGESWKEVFSRSREFLNSIISKYVKDDFIDPLLAQESPMDVSMNLNNQNIPKMVVKKNTNEIKYLKSNTITIYKDSLRKTYSSSPKKDLKRGETISQGIQEALYSGGQEDSHLKNKISVNKKDIKMEYFFALKSIDEIRANKLYTEIIERKYFGYYEDSLLSRILVVSHSGFIKEFCNVLRLRKGISCRSIQDTVFTGVYVVKIYCFNCEGKCTSKDKNCKLEYDLILFNSKTHLGQKVEIK